MTFFGATLLAAIATAVLAVFAVVTAWYARRAFRAQSREVKAIEQQLDLQRRQFDQVQAERRRVQASQVSLWQGPLGTNLVGAQVVPVHLQNNSLQQLYYPRFGWDLNGRLTGLVLYSAPQFLPGDTIDVNLPFPTPSDPPEPGTVIAPAAVFRDHAGVWWCLRNDGRLDDLSELPPSEIARLLHPFGAPHVETAPDAEQ